MLRKIADTVNDVTHMKLESLYTRVHSLPRLYKQLLMAAADIVLLVFSVWAAYSLRFADWFVPSGRQWLLMLAVPVLALPIFVTIGLYRSVIRYVGEHAMWAIVRGVTLAILLWTGLAFFSGIGGTGTFPRSVPLIAWLVAVFLVGGARFFARWVLWRPVRKRYAGRQVLIYGAGTAGRQLASSLRQGTELFPAGFIDSDSGLQSRDVDGLRVYAPHQLSWLIEHFGISDLIVTESSLSPSRRKEVMTELQKYPVEVRILPAISEIASGRYMVQSLRELGISDLLGREPVMPNPALIARNITDKIVAVTGAGGSIGAELCRQILLTHPSKLLLIDNGEYNLYAIHAEITKYLSGNKELRAVEVVPLIGNVCDYGRMSEIFRAWQPDTVYHSAAYKHVPLVEFNPAEGVRNNVFGTLTVARTAVENGTADFVLISTDKAVRPTNIMGASKRLAEMLLQAMAATPLIAFEGEPPSGSPIKNKTRFSMVRFGNVLGSSGSVVPLFTQQIKEGGPITLTDPNIVRYFMTIQEASQLVIQAGAMAEGGDVFILDMGEAVKIIDLAYRMVELSGLQVRDEKNPDGDIAIVVTGLRPGEKLYEELLIGDNSQPTAHPRIMKAHENFIAWEPLKKKLQPLLLAVNNNNAEIIRHLLKGLVSGYRPASDTPGIITLAENDATFDNAVG